MRCDGIEFEGFVYYFPLVSSCLQILTFTWPLWIFSLGEQRPLQPGWAGLWPSCCTGQRYGTILQQQQQQKTQNMMQPVYLSSLTLIIRCRPGCMRRCVQCWRADTPSTVTDTDSPSSALWSMRCSDSGQLPRWRCHTEPSETAGQLSYKKKKYCKKCDNVW